MYVLEPAMERMVAVLHMVKCSCEHQDYLLMNTYYW